ncbi:uncharacterized protein CCOS01_11521 [Colletotrichum costaricense]|uniref:Uncharacterized protein n=1 Tax=Colletotrichum costaricense TaxID=1209916 RepID=A0AAJ0DX87_9PEZI|nr:uncharacterized protein CCOS01_11521 [Colletotrichum costaricense]KAK1518701.1 hypothetical protein CCOS01_11521 [Colletotrichum costaricense]
MASDEVSQLFWLQYGDAIRQESGVRSDNKIFFLATEAQKGPLAGNNVPGAYTARGLYSLGNNLLSTNSVFYSPSALHGYDKAIGLPGKESPLLHYSNSANEQKGGKSNPALDANFLDALKKQATYQKAFDKEQDNAHAQWRRDTDRGLTDKAFNVWVQSGNAPARMAAKDNVDSISQTIINLQLHQGGPLAVAVKKDRDSLRMGKNEEMDFVGYNMHAAIDNGLSTAEIISKNHQGDDISEPSFQRLPLYEAGSYKQFVQDALQEANDGDYSSPQRIEVNIDVEGDASDYEFGQTGGDGNIGAGTGWFSFSDDASHSEESYVLETGSESSEVEVTVTYNSIQAISITTGPWNVDMSKYKLRSDAPNNIKTLTRASQAIAVAGLGYEITVGESTAEILDTKLEETKNAGGSISIFGVHIGLGGSGEDETHTYDWDLDSRTFRVTPNFDNNVVTVVGAVAEKY